MSLILPMPSRATAPSGSPNFVGFTAAACGSKVKSVNNISVQTKLVFMITYSFLDWVRRLGNYPIYRARFQSTILLPYQEFPRGGEFSCGNGVACGLRGQCIEIDTACDGFTDSVSTVPIRRTAPSVIHSRPLMP